MKKVFLTLFLISICGCQNKKKTETADVNNTMTRTADALHDDVNRARAAVQKAQDANRTEEEMFKEGEEKNSK